MTDHPILFQADMVRAIMTCSKCGTITLDIECPKCGSKKRRKFETRRVVKPQPVLVDHVDEGGHVEWVCPKWPHLQVDGVEDLAAYARWQPGDLLWVREGFRCTGGGSWKGILYRADGDDTPMSFCGVNDGRAKTISSEFWPEWDHLVYETNKSCEWRPSIFMPKWACRNWLKVLAGGVERVQEISHVDIEAEGVTFDLITNLLKPTKTKQGHWISGGEYDASEDYCYDCAKKRVDELNGMDGDKDYVVDGGWESHDSDYIAHCEKCDCLLNYWPTRHLFETELDGFESCGEIIPLHNEDRYLFDTLCCAAPDQNEAIQNRTLKLCWQYLWDSVYAKPRPRYHKKQIIYYESYPWKAGTETSKYRGKPWHIHGNPFVFTTTFERYDK